LRGLASGSRRAGRACPQTTSRSDNSGGSSPPSTARCPRSCLVRLSARPVAATSGRCWVCRKLHHMTMRGHAAGMKAAGNANCKRIGTSTARPLCGLDAFLRYHGCASRQEAQVVDSHSADMAICSMQAAPPCANTGFGTHGHDTL
jgi:hypothetical protein